MFQRMTLSLLCCGLLVPQSLLAESAPATAKTAEKVTDVRLQKDSTAIGQLVDTQGNPVAGAHVGIFHGGKLVARTKTAKNGQYAVRDLRGGIHQVVAAGDATVVRFWTTESAPPLARKSVVMVTDAKVIRGQDEGYVVLEEEYCDDDGGFMILDVVTLGTIGLGAAGLIYAIENNNDINDLQANQAPQSP